MDSSRLLGILPMLVCPDCRAPLQNFEGCSCGAKFDVGQDGTPKLFPNRGETIFQYRFQGSRAVKGARFEDAFRYPPEAKAESKPYHLDDAHLYVLGRQPPGQKVLEIGCGGAQMRRLVEQMGHIYLGTDISKTRVHSFLQADGGADLLCDAHFLPVANSSVDVVYSIATAEHLACPHLVVQNVANCLKPGGLFLGNVSFLEPWHDDSFYHMSPLGAYELLVQAGLDPLYIWPGRGWSGFKALLAMGNKVTKHLAFVGAVIDAGYSAGNRLKRAPNRILEQARVAGAVNWIAKKPN